MKKPREVCLSCYFPRCTEVITYGVKKGARMRDAYEELEGRAGTCGWMMGLDSDGQAHYGCPDHGTVLLDARKLTDQRPMFRRFFRKSLLDGATPPHS